MTKGDVGPFNLKKHTFSKWVYQKYRTWSIDIEPPKSNSLKKQMGYKPP
jgi:hypothetical protein